MVENEIEIVNIYIFTSDLKVYRGKIFLLQPIVEIFHLRTFFTIIIDMLKGIFVLFDKTVHFKHCSFWLRLKAFCFGKTAERLSTTM